VKAVKNPSPCARHSIPLQIWLQFRSDRRTRQSRKIPYRSFERAFSRCLLLTTFGRFIDQHHAGVDQEAAPFCDSRRRCEGQPEYKEPSTMNKRLCHLLCCFQVQSQLSETANVDLPLAQMQQRRVRGTPVVELVAGLSDFLLPLPSIPSLRRSNTLLQSMRLSISRVVHELPPLSIARTTHGVVP